MTPLETLLIFTAEGCPHCRAAIDDFRARGVRFREINLSREPEGIERLRALCWEHRVPVIADHERISIGFRGRSSAFADVGLE